MAFTEFYVDAVNGSNLNGGAPVGGAYPFTYAAGAWVSGTGVFTVAGGNPLADGVQAGDFAAVYPGTPVNTQFVGRVTARDATTITVSPIAKNSQSAPATGTCTCKVGGAWAGPTASVLQPVTSVTSALTNTAGNAPRVNWRNNAAYTTALSGVLGNQSGPMRHQGYAATPGDGGRFSLTTSAGTICSLGVNVEVADAILAATLATGTGIGVLGAQGTLLTRVTVHGTRGSGISLTNDSVAEECEVYDCNRANDSTMAGFLVSSFSRLIRCYSHDNLSGVNAHGIRVVGTGASIIDSISESNGGAGLQMLVAALIDGCTFYGNAGDGLIISPLIGAFSLLIENSAFFRNGGWGLNCTSTDPRVGRMVNCAFGSGAQANTSGMITGLLSLEEIGSVIYPANLSPWNAPATGDFRIVDASNAVKGAGRGNYTQSGGGKTGTIGYPDIGAAQSIIASGGGAILSRVRTGF